jgi:hypothetical protein
VEEASVVVVLAVVDTPEAEEASAVVVVSEAGAALAHSAAASEPGAAEVASASVERASQVGFRTLLARDRASLHLGIHHIGNLSIPDELAEQ